jgi:meso-butanediol dehydrogenase/(S,S)-butanediol dehydrogenase/diacetyl reductase
MSVADVFGTLEGKVALVTGAGGGIGTASCAALQAAGATVVATDIDPTGASRCTADDFVVADISDPDQVEGLIAHVVERFGRIDVVHGNAGINVPGRPHSYSVEDYRRVVGVCQDANFWLVRSSVGHMRAEGGVFVFTSSMCGVGALPRSPVYNMAKHALIGLAQSVALDYGPQGIRAVALVTGPTMTPMIDELWGPPDGPMRRALVETTSTGRFAYAEEIARAVVFAALPGNGSLTGCALTVDGGATAGWNSVRNGMAGMATA